MKFLIFFHVIGATVWVGGHLVLAFGYLPAALKNKSVSELQNYESKFERIGIPSLLLQIITGLWLAMTYVPDYTDWFNFNSPTRTIGIKLILLLITLALALDARLRVIPKLTVNNLSSLAWHIIPVTAISVLFVYVGISYRFGGV